tara:strand:+ start:1168 stop:1443 length:276 start_codon:yes stop_codon:yes gene_type:complete
MPKLEIYDIQGQVIGAFDEHDVDTLTLNELNRMGMNIYNENLKKTFGPLDSLEDFWSGSFETVTNEYINIYSLRPKITFSYYDSNKKNIWK